MIPAFDLDTGNLPPGVHPAKWADVEAALGFNAHRRALLAGLLAGCRQFKKAGVGVMFINGSFATGRRAPRDFDCCYSPKGVNHHALDTILLEFDSDRQPMKRRYGGEFFPTNLPIQTLEFEGTILEWFQRDKDDRRPKGIIALDLASLP
jgi:hypothetical protein